MNKIRVRTKPGKVLTRGSKILTDEAQGFEVVLDATIRDDLRCGRLVKVVADKAPAIKRSSKEAS
jgi:hypothetical protein